MNEKCKILSEILETKLTNLDDYACPKIQAVISKMKKKIGGAERKAFAYGT